ncbi:hypothetical protein BU25DRAFT_192022 [Macroventuria anomochaeta]|uniref:Uncharacterized protein n=1 Tax=Macroventuria anomochaeta TaxID=301207 RepID=A0ACB6SDD6_9PLEO|nr:uncharacterized protein BU25DRAFT_192022 [Macroventuria anomochaeta]KAF2631615.1 hypothetical protein BU25DRAFT_192022 [Macroventuria anomochaeta]
MANRTPSFVSHTIHSHNKHVLLPPFRAYLDRGRGGYAAILRYSYPARTPLPSGRSDLLPIRRYAVQIRERCPPPMDKIQQAATRRRI